MTDKGLFRHLWTSYQSTIDGRQKHGDVELLAEAAERIEWPEAPEIGTEIARLLRLAYVGDKVDLASKHYRVVRDRAIFGLSLLLEGQEEPFILKHDGGTQQYTSKHEYIAKIYGMNADAVRKVVKRNRKQIAEQVKKYRLEDNALTIEDVYKLVALEFSVSVQDIRKIVTQLQPEK